ncbi:MAG TPA: hypothetical protein VMT22_11005, partial [Terriglobales bacterium]|nr:hypothetical protein [Terriglobales bacterium]
AGIEDSYELEASGGEIDTRPLIRAVVEDVLRGISTDLISAKFHNAVAAAVLDVTRQIRASEGLNRVALSGGTFQNFYLLHRTVKLLRAAGFDVLLHSTVPTNDGGLALGQAVIASQIP